MYATSPQLAELCARARADGRLGLDLEFIRERSYYPELALAQISVGETCALVDPLDDGIDLSPLEALVADPKVVKVLHAATQDLEIFYLRTGRAPRNIFDTQLAAALVGLGSQMSYAALVAKTIGDTVEKGETLTDWLRRPLTEAQERYALADVEHLLPIHDRLLARLAELGRESWVSEECARYEDVALYDPDLETLIKRTKRAATLKGRAAVVVRELVGWREELAKQRNRPRRSVIADEPLVELARSAPRNVKGLERTRGVHPALVRHSGEELLAAIRRGLDAPVDSAPKREARPRIDDGTALAVDLLDTCLRSFCDRADIAPSMVANRGDLERLVVFHKAGDLDHEKNPLLSGWRGELVGDDLLAVLEGRIAIYFDPATGRPQFEARLGADP